MISENMLTTSDSNIDSPTAQAVWRAFCDYVYDRRSRKEVCLLPMILAGFPDRNRCFRYANLLQETGVQLVELVDPVLAGWASTTNNTIREAHRTASSHMLPGDCPELAKRFTGSLKIVYEGNITTNLASLVSSCLGVYSILQLALPSESRILDPRTTLSIPTTTQLSAFDDLEQIVETAKQARWMIVCKIADRTGGNVIESHKLSDCLAAIRGASNLPVFCTFGISEPHLVETIRTMGNCDGVIIGTSLLERLTQSLTTTEEFLQKIWKAASS
jgi:tryptophan synthase alpha subunit